MPRQLLEVAETNVSPFARPLPQGGGPAVRREASAGCTCASLRSSHSSGPRMAPWGMRASKGFGLRTIRGPSSENCQPAASARRGAKAKPLSRPARCLQLVRVTHVPVRRIAARRVRMRVRRRRGDGSRRRRAFDGYSIQQYRTSNQAGPQQPRREVVTYQGQREYEQQPKPIAIRRRSSAVMSESP